MEETPYAANYQYALSLLKSNKKEAAIEALRTALAQVPGNEKNEDNLVYIDILSNLAFLLREKNEFGAVTAYVREGLAVKKNHADLLLMKALLVMDMKNFDEMLETLIHYLLALGDEDRERFNYHYINEGALKEVYETLLPMACKYAFEFEKMRDITDRLYKVNGSQWLKRACQVMDKVAGFRSDKENS